MKKSKKKIPKQIAQTLATIKAEGCFRCDGTKQICDVCGESSRACKCGDNGSFSECPDCKPK